MLTTIRRLGNSRGILIPKPLLKQAGLEDEAEILLEGNTLVLRAPRRRVRSGWEAASRRLSECGDDRLVMPEFGNDSDADLKW